MRGGLSVSAPYGGRDRYGRVTPWSERYVLTDLGRAAIADAQVCVCRWDFDGGLVVCHSCGTVYSTSSVLAASSRRPVAPPKPG